MDSDALNTFLTVHRRGGVSHAASALHRSQPAISRRIALLEQRARRAAVRAGCGPHAAQRCGPGHGALCRTRGGGGPGCGECGARAAAAECRGRCRSRWSARSPADGCRKSCKRFARECPDVELALRTATSAEVSDLIRRGDATIGLRYNLDRSRDLDCERLSSRAVAGRLRAGSSAGRPSCRAACRSCAANAGSPFRRCRAAAKSRPRMCSRCS